MRQSLLLLIVIILVSACSDKDKFIVSGHIEGGKNKTLYLERIETNQTTTVLDSVKLKNGEFKFRNDRLSEPTFLKLKLSDKNFVTILADSTETVIVNAEAQNLEATYLVQNSEPSAYILILNRRVRKLNDALNKLAAQYKATSTDDIETRKALEAEYEQKINEHKAFVGEFILDHPRSFAGYYALFQTFDDQNTIMNVFDEKDQVYFAALATSLNLYFPDSERAKQLYNYVLGAKTKQQREKFANELIASQASQSGYVDIEAPNLKGDTIKLSSLEGKTIIVNFWASWDKKSVAANRHLKKMYNKYRKNGLEVYSVSLDKSKVLWESAIVNEGYEWVDVSDLRYTDSYPARLYNIKQIPANYIISSKGEIIGKDLFGNRLTDKLNEIF